MLQPIDVMKTRLQLDHSGQYKGACAAAAAACARMLAGPVGHTVAAWPAAYSCSLRGACLPLRRHDQLRPHHCSRRGHQVVVEGPDAVCGPADPQVRAAHGLQRFLS